MLWLSHDATNLFLTAAITDYVQSQPARNDSLWMGDGVQIGANMGWPGEELDVSEIGTALAGSGRQGSSFALATVAKTRCLRGRRTPP